MNSKLWIVFALCVYEVSATGYGDAFLKCKKEYGLADDKPLDYFLENGKFQKGFENLECIFQCLTSSLNLNDADGNPNGVQIQELAKQNQDKPELQLFADPDVQKACLLGKDQSSPCAKTLSFVTCALEVKAKAQNSAPK